MKTKIITTLKKELLIIEFPEGYELAGVANGVIYYYDNQMNYEDYPLSILVEGFYTLLGKPSEIREEYAEELVEPFDFSYYVDYNHPSRGAYTITATESLLSALESEIYWDVNPLGHSAEYYSYIGEERHWRESELRTFDKKRTLIFVKN